MEAWQQGNKGWQAQGWIWGLRFAALCVGVGFVLTIPFWIWPLDLSLQQRFFDDEAAWKWANHWLWRGLYDWGTLPAVLVVVSALVALLAGYRWPAVRRWRRVALYLIASLALGPGIVINAVFKEHWGRPRPRHVENFGGPYVHERVWTYDARSPGKSFPCGHCSMGFYFLGVALLLGRTRRGLWVAVTAAGGGVLIGMARVAQGGHFLSDVLWSGTFTLAASGVLFYGLGLHRGWAYTERENPKRQRVPWYVWTGAGGVLGAALLVIGLATPHQRDDRYAIEVPEGKPFEVSLLLEGDQHMVRSAAEGELAGIRVQSDGHGLPGSAIKEVWTDEGDGEEPYFQLKQRHSGWFAELLHRNTVVLPAEREGFVKIRLESGRLHLDASELRASQRWLLLAEEDAVVSVTPPGPGFRERFQLDVRSGRVQISPSKGEEQADAPVMGR